MARKLFNGKHAHMLNGIFSVKQDDTYESVECFNSEETWMISLRKIFVKIKFNVLSCTF